MARASARPFRQGFRLSLHFAGWLWMVDAVVAASTLGGDPRIVSQGLLTGLFVSLGMAAVAGLCLGAVLWLSRPVPAEQSGPGFQRWLFEPVASQPRRAGGLVGGLFLLALYSGSMFAVLRQVAIRIAQPHFVALAALGVSLVLAATMLLLLPAARNLGRVLMAALGRLGLPASVATAGHVVVFVAFVATAVAGTVLLLFWSTLSYLPWDAIGSVAAAIGLTAAWDRARPPRPLALGVRALGYGAAAASLIATLSMQSHEVRIRKIAEGQTLGGRLGYVLADGLLDFDGDGHLHVLGGGDCAPFSANRHPGAIDRPGNGIDEDCDGHDLSAADVGFESRTRHPVPKAFPRRPPILLITVDAFAARQMTALGGRRKLTPHLDAFAARSALFGNCFSQGPSTRLSFPSIFTSRWDSEIKRELVGKHPYPIGDSELTLAEVLADTGYNTVAVLPTAYFDRRHWKGLTAGFDKLVDAPYRVKPQPRHNSRLVTDAALEQLAKKRRKPLFMWVHYYDAHSPHSQPRDVPSLGKTREDLYSAELRFVDEQVGRLLDGLDALKEPPLVIITSDHGIAFDKPRHRKLNYGYDLHTVTLNVPLIVNAPFVKPGVREGITSTMDVAPTIANLLRLRDTFPFRGVSLVPELVEHRSSRAPRLMHQFYLQERLWDEREPLEFVSVRTDRYNLIHDRRVGSYQLYDWREDYFERRDLSELPAHADTLYAMKQQLSLFAFNLHIDRSTGRDRAAPR